ncbi:MAG: hypothetical protein BWY66_01859 [bacterium ADurb.Bin374]|nr:MAG: hypothetical protein BWY66_01859 [bacterium ADurb.Bin374]
MERRFSDLPGRVTVRHLSDISRPRPEMDAQKIFPIQPVGGDERRVWQVSQNSGPKQGCPVYMVPPLRKRSLRRMSHFHGCHRGEFRAEEPVPAAHQGRPVSHDHARQADRRIRENGPDPASFASRMRRRPSSSFKYIGCDIPSGIPFGKGTERASHGPAICPHVLGGPGRRGDTRPSVPHHRGATNQSGPTRHRQPPPALLARNGNLAVFRRDRCKALARCSNRQQASRAPDAADGGVRLRSPAVPLPRLPFSRTHGGRTGSQPDKRQHFNPPRNPRGNRPAPGIHPGLGRRRHEPPRDATRAS